MTPEELMKMTGGSLPTSASTMYDGNAVIPPGVSVMGSVPEHRVPLAQPYFGKFARTDEFNQVKRIKVLMFESLTPEEILQRDGRETKYKPDDGLIRRLTFLDVAYKNGTEPRYLDVNSPRFQDDVAKSGIARNDVVYVQRIKKGVGYQWAFSIEEKPTTHA